MSFDNRIDHILISEADIEVRVNELAAEIAAHYQNRRPVLVGVLTGAFVFMADIVRKLGIPVEIEFIAVSSYGIATRTSGEVQLVKDLGISVDGREILIVEDIIDSGLTLQYLKRLLLERRPVDIRTVVLLRKPTSTAQEMHVDWVGFDVPDEFVVGYGLDLAGAYRNLRYIGAVRSADKGDITTKR